MDEGSSFMEPPRQESLIFWVTRDGALALHDVPLNTPLNLPVDSVARASRVAPFPTFS
jgi:hypothetical protein